MAASIEDLNTELDAMVAEVMQGTLLRNIKARIISHGASEDLATKMVRIVEIRSNEFIVGSAK